MSYFLGFDGGGTKTDCVVLDSSGRVVARGTAGPSNPLRVGFAAALAALHDSARQALRAARLSRKQVSSVCAGLAGAGRRSVAQRMARGLWKIFPRARVQVTTDLAAALEAAAGAGPGVVLVAGTGSAAYGRNAAGRTARAGGHGPWISDQGSAFDIGRRALAAAARARDGLAPPTSFEQAALRALRCASWDAMLERVARRPHEALPSLFPVVVRAGARGDRVAGQILQDAAKELARLASSVVRRLRLGRRPFPIALVGGVFGRSRVFDRRVRELLAGLAPRARVRLVRVPPALGAGRLARRNAASDKRRAAGPGKEPKRRGA